MIVYEISSDVDKCRSVEPIDSGLMESDLMKFNGDPIVGWDEPVEMRIIDLNKPSADFYHFDKGALAFSPKVLDCIEMRTVFEISGDILPVKLESGEELFILNVTHCCNPINLKETEWYYSSSGERGSVKKYVFHNRFGFSLLKIPENNYNPVLTYTRIDAQIEDEFLRLYRYYKLTGLIFKELWASEDHPPIRLVE